MRLLKTAAVSLCIGMGASVTQAAPFELSGTTMEIGPWITKSIFDIDPNLPRPRVAAIAQYRSNEDSVGNNLQVVIHLRDGSTPPVWSSKTWVGESGRDGAIKWAMGEWALPTWQIDRWQVSVPAFDFTSPPQPVDFGGGVPAGDPFDGILQNLPNGAQVIRWLEESGYSAAMLPKTGDPVEGAKYLEILAAAFEYGQQTGDHYTAAIMAANNPPAGVLPTLPGEEEPYWAWTDRQYIYKSAAATFHPGGLVCSPVYCDQTDVAVWYEGTTEKKRFTKTRNPGGQTRSWGDAQSQTVVNGLSATVIEACYTQSCNRVESRQVFTWPLNFYVTPDMAVPPTIKDEYRLAAWMFQCCVQGASCSSPPPCILNVNGDPNGVPQVQPWGPTVPSIPTVVPAPTL